MATNIHPQLKNIYDPIIKSFQCQNSGNCCKAEGYVFASDSNLKKMRELLNTTEAEFQATYVKKHNGWNLIAGPNFRPNCFLDDCNHCQVYEARPKMCRTYPDWSVIWESPEALQAELKTCPGLQKAYDVAVHTEKGKA